MNILQISEIDKPGNRFNGLDLTKFLISKNHNAKLFAWSKKGSDPFVIQLSSRWQRYYNNLIAIPMERILGIQSILQMTFFSLFFNRFFWKAEVLHLHIIHSGFFSILFLPILTRLKKVVWTLHDPWALTGHCVHPLSCDKWKRYCDICPHPDWPFPIKFFNVSLMFELKKKVYKKSRLTIVVHSEWMRSMVKQSELLSNFQVNLILPGIDLDTFRPPDSKKTAKKKLGIPEDCIAIAFRQSDWVFKGLNFIKSALEELKIKNIVILTCDQKGKLGKLYQLYPCYELGVLVSDIEIVDFFQASDIFLMPSIAESFGMMAMEASCCGVPSIVSEGTPLPEVCFTSYGGGISVPQNNKRAFVNAIEMLCLDKNKREKMGEISRRLAIEMYSLDAYGQSHIRLYNDIRHRREQNNDKSNVNL